MHRYSPDVQHICLADVVVGYGAAEVVLAVLHVGLAVEHLDEVVVAVVGHLELVLGELEVDLLALLGPDDPGAVDGHAVLRGVAHVLLRDVGRPDVVRGAADLELALGDEWNAFERIWNEIVNSSESIVLNRAVRHEPEMEQKKRSKYSIFKLQFVNPL